MTSRSSIDVARSKLLGAAGWLLATCEATDPGDHDTVALAVAQGRFALELVVETDALPAGQQPVGWRAGVGA